MATTRNAQIATIKIAAKQLGLDDDTYRAMLHDKTGKTSAADLDWQERKAIIDHLVKCGAKIERKGAPSTLARNDEYMKIEALLADMRLPWSYADAIAENITGGKATGIPRLGWVKNAMHLQGVIAALTYEQRKRFTLARVDDLLKAAGKAREDIPPRLNPQYKKDWTRDIKALNALVVAIPEWWPVAVK
jgi:phage gp16-like protein